MLICKSKIAHNSERTDILKFYGKRHIEVMISHNLTDYSSRKIQTYKKRSIVKKWFILYFFKWSQYFDYCYHTEILIAKIMELFIKLFFGFSVADFYSRGKHDWASLFLQYFHLTRCKNNLPRWIITKSRRATSYDYNIVTSKWHLYLIVTT